MTKDVMMVPNGSLASPPGWTAPSESVGMFKVPPGDLWRITTSQTGDMPMQIPTDLKPGDKLWYSETECAIAELGPAGELYEPGTSPGFHPAIMAIASHRRMRYNLHDGTEHAGDTPPIIRIERGTSAPSPAQKPDPLIFGASIPGCEPVPKRDEYVPLTDGEVWKFSIIKGTERSAIRDAHRAGWERRRTP